MSTMKQTFKNRDGLTVGDLQALAKWCFLEHVPADTPVRGAVKVSGVLLEVSVEAQRAVKAATE